MKPMTINQIIDQLTRHELAYFVRNYPRIEAKVRMILREEVADGNLHSEDVRDFETAVRSRRTPAPAGPGK